MQDALLGNLKLLTRASSESPVVKIFYTVDPSLFILSSSWTGLRIMWLWQLLSFVQNWETVLCPSKLISLSSCSHSETTLPRPFLVGVAMSRVPTNRMWAENVCYVQTWRIKNSLDSVHGFYPCSLMPISTKTLKGILSGRATRRKDPGYQNYSGRWASWPSGVPAWGTP